LHLLEIFLVTLARKASDENLEWNWTAVSYNNDAFVVVS
jgi:hypothetical protein